MLRVRVGAFCGILQCNEFTGLKSNLKILHAVLGFSMYTKLEYRCWKALYSLCRKTPGVTFGVTFHFRHVAHDFQDLELQAM
jgi:hypothetical protein